VRARGFWCEKECTSVAPRTSAASALRTRHRAKRVSSDGFTLPLDLQVRESAVLDDTVTVTHVGGPQAGQVTVVPTQQTVTFGGSESLTLSGKTFSNVCRIKLV